MKHVLTKALAVLEVSIVTFVLVPSLTLGLYQILPGFEAWQTEEIGFPFPVFVYVVMAGLSLLAPLLRHRALAEYGITFKNLKYHLSIAAACFVPVALADVPLGLLDYKSWGGALILAAIQLGLLFVLAWLLRKRPSAESLGIAAMGVLLAPAASSPASVTASKVVVLFMTYALFVGFGEEILYRGYMQSRLNEAFGKPYRFFGVSFGWGAIITALLFGLTHVGLLHWILGPSGKVTVAWGFWTFFGGLVSGFVREKSGGILAPALLHGLPQAIATVAMQFL